MGEMIDGAIRLFRSHFATLIKISAAVLGPIGLVQLIGTIAVGPLDLTSAFVPDPDLTPQEVLGPLVPVYTVLGITAIISFLGSVWVQAASILALTQVYQGIQPDWKNSLRASLRRFLPLTLATILITFVPAIGLVFCLVPGVWLWTMWSVTPAALMAEQKGAIQSMGRSWQLVKGRFWPVLGAMVLGYLLYWVVSQIVGTVTGVVTFAGMMGGSDTISFIPSVVGSIVVSILSAPFLAAMVTIVYFDLRVRKEGYDLELMAADLQRMESEAHLGAPPPESDDNPFGLDPPVG